MTLWPSSSAPAAPAPCSGPMAGPTTEPRRTARPCCRTAARSSTVPAALQALDPSEEPIDRIAHRPNRPSSSAKWWVPSRIATSLQSSRWRRQLDVRSVYIELSKLPIDFCEVVGSGSYSNIFAELGVAATRTMAKVGYGQVGHGQVGHGQGERPVRSLGLPAALPAIGRNIG